MAISFFTLSGLSFVLILLSRHTESWGWSVPSFASSWEQVSIWATYALIFFLAIAMATFCFGPQETSNK